MNAQTFKNVLRGAALPIGALFAAEISIRASGIQSDSLALPSAVLRALGAGLADAGVLLATLQTLGCALGGVAIGAGMGLLLGLVLGISHTAAGLANVSVESLRHMPPVALIPIATLVLGLGMPMEMSIVAFTCFWPVLLLTQAAVNGVERQLLEVARMLTLSGAETIQKIVLPAAAPRIAVALRLAMGIALIVAITTEVAANPLGLGYGMVRAQQELQPAQMYAYLVWLAILGWAINSGLLWLQRRCFAPELAQ